MEVSPREHKTLSLSISVKTFENFRPNLSATHSFDCPESEKGASRIEMRSTDYPLIHPNEAQNNNSLAKNVDWAFS
jgi:hypothetical protein